MDSILLRPLSVLNFWIVKITETGRSSKSPKCQSQKEKALKNSEILKRAKKLKNQKIYKSQIVQKKL